MKDKINNKLTELERYILIERPKGESEFKYRVILMIVAIFTNCMLNISDAIYYRNNKAN